MGELMGEESGAEQAGAQCQASAKWGRRTPIAVALFGVLAFTGGFMAAQQMKAQAAPVNHFSADSTVTLDYSGYEDPVAEASRCKCEAECDCRGEEVPAYLKALDKCELDNGPNASKIVNSSSGCL